MLHGLQYFCLLKFLHGLDMDRVRKSEPVYPFVAHSLQYLLTSWVFYFRCLLPSQSFSLPVFLPPLLQLLPRRYMTRKLRGQITTLSNPVRGIQRNTSLRVCEYCKVKLDHCCGQYWLLSQEQDRQPLIALPRYLSIGSELKATIAKPPLLVSTD